MKRFYGCIILLSMAVLAFSSCEKTSGGSGGDDPGSGTDIRLVGNWNVDKYEAHDGRDSVIMTITNPNEILKSFHRFDFDVNCSSQTGLICWVEGSMFIGMDYSYSSSTSMIRFGDFEYAKASLSELELSFDTRTFVPTQWLEGGSRLKDGIDYVKVHCTKAVTLEQ